MKRIPGALKFSKKQDSYNEAYPLVKIFKGNPGDDLEEGYPFK